jgi:ADP-ribose pyrophosphatase YjhB (NUDIX family)
MSAADDLHAAIAKYEREKVTIFDIAKAMGVPTNNLPHNGGAVFVDALYDRVLAQLKKVPYIPFPVALHTVDMILTRATTPNRHDLENIEILMGRKPGKTLIQFIGGFMDPVDVVLYPNNTVERGAVRELLEETNITFNEKELIYLGSHWINDVRYQGSPHQITSSIYTGMIDYDLGSLATGSDDIEEVSWVPFSELKANYKETVLPAHHPLVEMFLNYLK